jgi:hypothetical protein
MWYGEHAHALGAQHLLSHSQVTYLGSPEWAVSTQQIYEAEEESSIEQEHESSVRREGGYCGRIRMSISFRVMFYVKQQGSRIERLRLLWLRELLSPWPTVDRSALFE